MQLHGNARTTPYIRREMVRRVRERAEPVTETAAALAPERKEMTEIVYRFSDYRRAWGPIQLPFRMEYWVGGERTGYNVIQHVTINGGIDARLFDPASHEQGKDHRPGNPER